MREASRPRGRVLEFGSRARGNVAPLRALSLPFSAPYGEDARGNFWVGFQRFRPDGRTIGAMAVVPQYGRERAVAIAADSAQNFYVVTGRQPSSAPVILLCPFVAAARLIEYAANTYGHPKATRTVELGNVLCRVRAVAIARSGDVYVAENPTSLDGSARIVEYPATGNGRITPIRTIVIPWRGTVIPILDIGVDDSGDLYALVMSQSTRRWERAVLRYAPGSVTPEKLPAAANAVHVAVGKNGHLFAVMHDATRSVEEFLPDSGVPLRRIAGSDTGLSEWPILGLTVRT